MVPEAPPIVPKVAPVVPEMVEEKPTILGMSRKSPILRSADDRVIIGIIIDVAFIIAEEFKKRLARPVWTLTSRKVYESRRDNRLLFNIDPFRQGPRDLHIAQRQRFAEHWCKKMAERRRAEAEARYDAMPIIRCQTLWRRALARRAVKQRFALEKRSQAAACEAIVKIMRLGLEKQHAYLRGENFRGRLLSEYLGPLNSEGSIKASITAVQAHSRGFNARVKAARDFASAPAPVAVTASAPTSSPFSPLPVRHQPADSMRQTGMSIPPTYADEAPVAAAETWMSLTSTSVAVVGNAPAQSWVSQTPTPVTMDASSAPVRSLVSQTPTFTAAQPSSSLPTPPPPSQPAPMPSHQAPISTPSAAAVSTPHPAPLLNMDSSVLPASACTSFPSRDGEKGTVGPTMSMSTDAAPAAGRRVLTAKRRARQDLTSGFQDTVVTAQREKIEEEKKSLQKVVDAQAKMIAEAEAPIQARDALHEQFRDHTDRVTINEEIARAQAQINAPNTFAASGQVTDQELLEDGSEEGEAREDGEGSEEGEVQEGGEDEDDGEFDHPFYGLTEEEISDLDSNASPPDWDRDELYDDAGDGADAGDGPYSPPYSVGSSGLSSTESMEDPTAPAAGPSGTALDPNGADADVDDGYADNPEDQVDFGGVDDEDDDEDDDGPPLLPMSAVQKGKQRALAAPSLAGVSGAWCVAHVERG